MLGVSIDDLFVSSSSSLTSASASESSVCVSSACSALSCASHRFRFSSSIFIMCVDKVLLKNLCHSLKRGVTTNLKKPEIDFLSIVVESGELAGKYWFQMWNILFKFGILEIKLGFYVCSLLTNLYFGNGSRLLIANGSDWKIQFTFVFSLSEEFIADF